MKSNWMFAALVLILGIFAIDIQIKSLEFNKFPGFYNYTWRFIIEFIVGCLLFVLPSFFNLSKLKKLKYLWLFLPAIFVLLGARFGYAGFLIIGGSFFSINTSLWALLIFSISLFYLYEEHDQSRELSIINNIIIGLVAILLTIYYMEESLYLYMLLMYMMLGLRYYKKSKLLGISVASIGIMICLIQLSFTYRGLDYVSSFYFKHEILGRNYQTSMNQKLIKDSDLLSFGKVHPKDNLRMQLPSPTAHSSLSLVFYHYGKFGAIVALALLAFLYYSAIKRLELAERDFTNFMGRSILILLIFFSLIHLGNVFGFIFFHSMMPFFSISRDLFWAGMLAFGISFKGFYK